MIGRKIVHKDTLDSTNNYVANLVLSNNIEHGTVILAGNQIQGKGQRATIWEAEPYKNITLSTFLKHDKLAVSDHFLLNQVISLACVEFLTDYCDGFKIKWPNDIVFGSSKIAGILIENQLESNLIKSSIVGIGLNINQSLFGDYNATSLKNICGQEFDLNELSLKLIQKLNEKYTLLQQKKSTLINEDYLKNLWLKDKISTFRDKDGEFLGEIIGVGEFGLLEVKRNSETKFYQHKEIEFLERKS